jgi:hypothetical protein
MRIQRTSYVSAISIVVLVALTNSSWAESPPEAPAPAKRTVAFRREVMPIFSRHCLRCHSSDSQEGGLVLSDRDRLFAGGKSGPAIVPGSSGKSLLIQRVASLDVDDVMPPEGERLSQNQLRILRAWIDEGAVWDSEHEYHLELAAVRPPSGAGHPLDRLLSEYFQKHAVAPPAAIGDERFARRVALDLVGVPLSPERLSEFLNDGKPDKRTRLVQLILADHENYVAHWMSFWSDHLRIGSAVATGVFDNDETKAPHKWLKAQLDDNVTYDTFVRNMFGSDFLDKFALSIAPPGEVASPVDAPEMQMAVTISQVLLGIQLKCASCHDSFIDRWTLNDAWGFASALGENHFQIFRCQTATGQKAQPRFPLVGLGDIDPDADLQQRRRQVAGLLTHAQNGLFTRTIVNRLWARLFGRGFVEPLDEMMEHEPWNAELLDWLAGELVHRNFDLKQLLELIATSQAYQSQAVVRRQPLQGKEYVFAGPEIRRLTAEQIVDSLSRLRQTKTDGAMTTRAWQLENDRLMNMLGRPNRDVVVTWREQESSPLLALELINGARLEELVQQAADAQLQQTTEPEVLVTRIYRSLLSRDPTSSERLFAKSVVSESSLRDAVGDLVWTIVMLPEFQLSP